MRNHGKLLIAGVLASFAGARAASAANHLWDLSELYSNSTGTIQFVEMHNDFNGEGFVNGLTITAVDTGATTTHTFTFPSNTPDTLNTANHFMLIATPGFGGLPGGVIPDFTIPAGFLFTNGGKVTYSGSLD